MRSSGSRAAMDKLAFQMILQRQLGGDGRFQPVLAFIGIAGFHRRPVGQRTGGRPSAARVVGNVAVIHIVMRRLVHVGGFREIVARQGFVGAFSPMFRLAASAASPTGAASRSSRSSSGLRSSSDSQYSASSIFGQLQQLDRLLHVAAS